MYFSTVFIAILFLYLVGFSGSVVSGAQPISIAKSDPLHECPSIETQPNLLFTTKPDHVTGVMNGTWAVVPIEMPLARRIIPAEYKILEKSYRALMPDFPAGQYPALLQLELYHDVRMQGRPGVDFQRASLYFTFVDRLGDGYTAMAYINATRMSTDISFQVVNHFAPDHYIMASIFKPRCEAYDYGKTSAQEDFRSVEVEKYSGIWEDAADFVAVFSAIAVGAKPVYPLEFWKNVTNQPVFSNNEFTCKNHIRLFNTSLSKDQFAPTYHTGSLTANEPFLPDLGTFEETQAIQLATVLADDNPVLCDTLKGYSGTKPGN
ncbi:hypothetical protein EJ08DRAFT_702464 [Tothia fuscella]|uniref:Uncharacterized protein n=1 Tax=Tothia fuscella TaxID=1048955 RepID=A0A9P4TTT5_9PEZI|nr:hypothetical protein EJ08DRAFT_702464 [Tothia fuscella]